MVLLLPLLLRKLQTAVAVSAVAVLDVAEVISHAMASAVAAAIAAVMCCAVAVSGCRIPKCATPQFAGG
jgi:hypothetical protein